MTYRRAIYIQTSYYSTINKTALLAAGITDIYIKANHDSTPTYDTVLPYVINQFSGSGVKIHAWVSCFGSTDGGGSSHWPDDTSWKNYLKTKILDIATNYDVDGVHLDYIRWSGVSPHISADQSPTGDTYVTGFVSDVYSIVKSVSIDIEVSIAAMPELDSYASTYVDDYFYGQKFEDLEDYLDFVAPMTYAGNYGKLEDLDWIGDVVDAIELLTTTDILATIQTYDSDSDPSIKTDEEMEEEAQIAIDAGSVGYGLFRYGLINDYPYIADTESGTPEGATDTGWEETGTAANVDAGTRTPTWHNTSYAEGTCSGSCTTATSAYIDNIAKGGGLSDYLKLTNFGFSIPSTATILGVEIQIAHRQGSTAHCIKDNILKLCYDGSVMGDNNASDEWWSTNYETFEYGDESEMWGCSLTPDMINDSSFGVMIQTKNYSSAYVTTFYIDCVYIKVHYLTSQTFTHDSEASLSISATMSYVFVAGDSAHVEAENAALVTVKGGQYDVDEDNQLIDNVSDGTDTLGDTTGFAAVNDGIPESRTEKYYEGSRSLKCTTDLVLLSGVAITDLVTDYNEKHSYTGRIWLETGKTLIIYAVDASWNMIGSAETLNGNDDWQYTTLTWTNTDSAKATRIVIVNGGDAAYFSFYLDKNRCYPGAAQESDEDEYPIIRGGASVECDLIEEVTVHGEIARVEGYNGYIGPIRLQRFHTLDSLTAKKKDSIISSVYRGHGVKGKKGEPSATNKFNIKLLKEKAIMLDGLVELDGFIPINTSLRSDSNDPLLPHGYALLSENDVDYLNQLRSEAKVTPNFLTKSLNPSFKFDYTKGVLDGTALDSEFDAVSLNYAVEADDWATASDDWNSENLVGLDETVDYPLYVEDEGLKCDLEVVTGGNYGYATVSHVDQYTPPLYVSADLYRDATPPTSDSVATGLMIGNRDFAFNDIDGMNELRCRLVHDTTTTTLIVDLYKSGTYTVLASEDLGSSVTECTITTFLDDETNATVWYDIGAGDVAVIEDVPIRLGAVSNLYVHLYADSTSADEYEHGWEDFRIWYVSYENQVTTTTTVVGEEASIGPLAPSIETNVDDGGTGNQWPVTSGYPLTRVETLDDVGTACDISSANETSDILRLTGFGFTIPDDATILGITVQYRRAESGTVNVHDNSVQLCYNAQAMGNDKANGSRWATFYSGTNYQTVTYGSSDDLWGLSNLTPAMINDSSFGVQVQVQNESSYLVTVYIDYIGIIVNYETGGGITTESVDIPSTIHNVVKAPITTDIMPPADFVRESAEGDIPCYINPEDEIYFTIPAKKFDRGSVKLWEGIQRVLSTDYVFETIATMENGVTKLEVNKNTGKITLYGYYDIWHEIMVFDIGEIYEVTPYLIDMESITLQVNNTRWKLARGNAYVDVEHTYTNISLDTSKTLFYHDDEYGTADEEEIIGVNETVAMDNVFYCNIYNEHDNFRLQVMKNVKGNIENDVIPMASLTGFGWYYKNAIGYEHSAYRAQEWLIKQATKILI